MADGIMDHATLRHEQRLATLERDHGEVRKAIDAILVEQRRHSELLQDQRDLAQKASENLATLLVLTERQTNMREALDRAFAANNTTRMQVDQLKELLADMRRAQPDRLSDRLAELEKAAPTTDLVKRWVFAVILAAAGAAATLGWKVATVQNAPPQQQHSSSPR